MRHSALPERSLETALRSAKSHYLHRNVRKWFTPSIVEQQQCGHRCCTNNPFKDNNICCKVNGTHSKSLGCTHCISRNDPAAALVYAVLSASMPLSLQGVCLETIDFENLLTHPILAEACQSFLNEPLIHPEKQLPTHMLDVGEQVTLCSECLPGLLIGSQDATTCLIAVIWCPASRYVWAAHVDQNLGQADIDSIISALKCMQQPQLYLCGAYCNAGNRGPATAAAFLQVLHSMDVTCDTAELVMHWSSKHSSRRQSLQPTDVPPTPAAPLYIHGCSVTGALNCQGDCSSALQVLGLTAALLQLCPVCCVELRGGLPFLQERQHIAMLSVLASDEFHTLLTPSDVASAAMASLLHLCSH